MTEWRDISSAPALQCLYTDDCTTLMAKGHHTVTAFLAACEAWHGGPMDGWGKVRHGWHRTIPSRSGEYTALMIPAKPHARGAYPTTTITDDPCYDAEGADPPVEQKEPTE